MSASKPTMLRLLLIGTTVLAGACGPRTPGATSRPAAPAASAVPGFPGIDRIRPEDLGADLFALAGDHTRGREAATIEELDASMWLVEQARAAGLEPAGENGTWFQWFPLRRLRQSETSRIVVGADTLGLWRDAAVFRSDHLPYARVNAPSLFFTTLLNEHYHTPFDNPERIDIAKLTRVTRWMYGTGWRAANAAARPMLDPGFRLER